MVFHPLGQHPTTRLEIAKQKGPLERHGVQSNADLALRNYLPSAGKMYYLEHCMRLNPSSVPSQGRLPMNVSLHLREVKLVPEH